LVTHPEEFIENLDEWVLGADSDEQYKAYLNMKYSTNIDQLISDLVSLI
jgi:hypothetical protein